MVETLAIALLLSGCAVQDLDAPSVMVKARLDADLGNLEEAARGFDSVARDEEAPARLRWEAGVRLGQTNARLRRYADSVETYRNVLESYGDDADAVRFLTLAIAGAAPEGERWDAAWREVRLVVQNGSEPRASIRWPGFASDTVGPGTGRPISIHVEDASVREIVRDLSDDGGFSYTIHSRADTRLSVSFENVPWDRALELSIRAAGLELRRDREVQVITEGNDTVTPAGFTNFGERGDAVALDFEDGELGDVLRLFADVSGLNIVVLPGVEGRVHARLASIPWERALGIVLASQGLAATRRGRVVVIAEPQRVGPYVAMETKNYEGAVTNVDFRGATFDEIASFFRRATGRELVARGTFRGDLTLKLVDVQSDHIVDLIGALKGVELALE